MITRTITRKSSLNVIKRLSEAGLRSNRVPVKAFSTLSRLDQAGSAPTSKPKSFKASSFAQPSAPEVTKQPKKQQLPEVPQEDIDDFEITKLTHGETDLKIAITKRASDKLSKIAHDDNNPDSALRIRVESGGCHGFQYNLDLTNASQELEKDSDLLIFARNDEQGAKVIFDESSLEILQDSKIDYTKELIGSSFKVVDSPYTSTECGCGASFDFDFDKLQKKLDQEKSK